MKWGVRRYQNYDGTYTQKGLERYRKASADYESARENASKAKSAYKAGTATKDEYKIAKSNARKSKKNLDKAYDKLKTDKMADEGKELYRHGKTITDNSRNLYTTEAAIVVGSTVANKMLRSYADVKTANVASSTIAIGGTVVNTLLAVKARNENKKLRAYYSH